MDKILLKIKEVAEAVCSKNNVTLYSIEYKNSILTILIDSKDGIDLDKCVAVSEAMSSELDKSDPIKEEYTLEVASVGSERPLNSLEEYKEHLNEFVLVHTSKLYEGYDELVGFLRDANEESIDLEIKIKTRKLTVRIDRKDIIDCSTYFEL